MKKHINQTFLRLSALALTSTLVACGGGGGGSSPNASTSTVSGTATKGLLSNAIIKAYAINASGQQSTSPVQETRTNAQGQFTLSGLPLGQLFLVELSSDSQTKMKDEATRTELSLPAGFKLRAAFKPTKAAETLSLSPLTDMAAALAASVDAPKLSEYAVNAANLQVTSAVGYDITTTVPTFAADGFTPTNLSALTLAAISQMAKDNSFSSCATVTEAAAKVDCTVKALSDAGPDDAAAMSKLSAARTQVNNALPTGSAIPAVLPVVPQTDVIVPQTTKNAIDEVKALIANLRSNDGAVSGDALRSRIEATVNSFQNVGSPEGGDALSLIRLIASSDGLFKANPSDYYSFPYFYNGCTAFSDVAGTTPASNPSAEIKSFRCDSYTTGNAAYFDTFYEYGLNEVLLTKTSNGFKAVIQPTIKRINWSPAYSETRRVAGTAQTLTLQGTFTPETAGESFTISGNLPTREVGLDVVAVNLSAKEQADGNGFTKVSLVGSLTGKLNGATKSTISVKEGYLRAKTATVGEAESPVSNAAGSSAKLVVEAAVNGGAKATGTLAADNFETLPNGKSGPKTMSFNGLIQHPDGGTLFDGNIAVTSTTKPLNQGGVEAFNTTTTTIKGTLPVPSRPAMELTASLIRTSETGSKTTGNFKQGSDTILFVITADTTNPGADSIKVNTPSGVGFTLTQGLTELPITKGSTTIGSFNKNTNKLVFADGSYQQF